MNIQMKYKLLLTAAIFSFSTMGAAMELTHGKLLSHKEWTTGNAKGTFANTSLKPQTHIHPLFKKPHVSLDTTISASVWDKVDSTPTGQVGKPVETDGFSAVNLINSNTEEQTFSIYSELCAWDETAQIGCVHSLDQVVVKPQDVASVYRYPQLTLTYTTPGQYSIWLLTDVSTGSALFQTNADGTVIITS